MGAVLDQGANPNHEIEGGTTSLMYAALEGNALCCKLLVEAGAAVDKVDQNQNTALDMAVMESKQEAGEYIRSVGGLCGQTEYPLDWAQPPGEEIAEAVIEEEVVEAVVEEEVVETVVEEEVVETVVEEEVVEAVVEEEVVEAVVEEEVVEAVVEEEFVETVVQQEVVEAVIEEQVEQVIV